MRGDAKKSYKNLRRKSNMRRWFEGIKEEGKLKQLKINKNKNYFYLKPHIGVAATPN